MVPAPRPGLLEEYEQYLAACAEYNRRGLQGEPENSDPGRLAQANFAPRCRHVRTGGVRCMAPALRGRTLCYAHTRIAAGKKAGLELPPLEDSSGIAMIGKGEGRCYLLTANCCMGITPWDRSYKSFVSLGTRWDIPWDESPKVFIYWDELLPGHPWRKGERHERC
jgi:hypothetical protein